MNPFKKAYCRSYQAVLALATHFLNFHEPMLIEGQGGLVEKVPSLLKEKGLTHPFIVIDKVLFDAKIQESFLKALEEKGIAYSVYSNITHEPTFDIVEEIVSSYREEGADCLIAIGGGSCLDSKGVLKVSRRLPFFLAVPTTAGTGSEVTVSSVVTNPATKDKFAINDPKLIPDVAVLDDQYLKSLPQTVIANTGLDALTHAVESYVNHHSTKKTRRCALESIRLINEHLVRFYEDREDSKARLGMLKASYLAGVSFTRAYVGYVHALAHSLGGYYHLPHGYLCALFLPHVLRKYTPSADRRLAEISDALLLKEASCSIEEKREAVFSWMAELYQKLSMPAKLSNVIKEEDIPAMAAHADHEANPLYPCPKLLDQKELSELLFEVKE